MIVTRELRQRATIVSRCASTGSVTRLGAGLAFGVVVIDDDDEGEEAEPLLPGLSRLGRGSSAGSGEPATPAVGGVGVAGEADAAADDDDEAGGAAALEAFAASTGAQKAKKEGAWKSCVGQAGGSSPVRSMIEQSA